MQDFQNYKPECKDSVKAAFQKLQTLAQQQGHYLEMVRILDYKTPSIGKTCLLKQAPFLPVFFFFFGETLDYARIQSAFSLCKTPSSDMDLHQLNGFLRNAFTLLAMMDYPYDTSFMSKMPAFPVKVQHYVLHFSLNIPQETKLPDCGALKGVVHHNMTIFLSLLPKYVKNADQCCFSLLYRKTIQRITI